MAATPSKSKGDTIVRRRAMPYSIEAEQSVLGGLILDNRKWPEVSAVVRAEDFYLPANRVVFSRMAELLSAGKECDFVTLVEALRSHGELTSAELEDSGGLAYVGGLANDTPSAANVVSYAQIVLERAILRGLIHAGDWIEDLGEKPEGQSSEALIARAMQRLEVLQVRAAPAEEKIWQHVLVRTESGAPKGTLANIVTILDRHRLWRDTLRLDVRSHQIVKCGMPVGEPSGPFSDADAVEIASWLGRPDTFKLSAATTQVREAVLAVASRRPFNPLTDWLDSLEWDGQDRVDTFFAKYCGSEASDYTATVARNFFLGSIARARSPGCKFDLMLILEGPQGLKKTSLFIALAGPEFYAEAMESPAHKDFYQSLQGRWLIEIAELQSFSKAEVSKVKQAITARWDFYRPSYGHFAKNYPRQCVFVGTTNEEDYLRDPTGARRFMPVRVTRIDVAAVEADRAQLWAEADVRYKRGEVFWTLPESAQAEQDARFQEDSWFDVVVRWVDGKADNDRYPDGVKGTVRETNTTQLLNWAVRIDTGKHGKTEQQRIGSIMRRLGWARVQKRVEGRVHWVYQRPSPPAKPKADG